MIVKTGEEINKMISTSFSAGVSAEGILKWIRNEVIEGMVVVQKEKWAKIDDILDDIVFLCKEYGLADESVLTLEANALRERVLAVKDDFRLEELRTVVET